MSNYMPDAPSDCMTTSTPTQTPSIKVIDLDEGPSCVSAWDLDSVVDESLLSPHYTPPQTPKRWRSSDGSLGNEASEDGKDGRQGYASLVTMDDADFDDRISTVGKAAYKQRRSWQTQTVDHVNEWFKESSIESIKSTVIIASYKLEDHDSADLGLRRNRLYPQQSRKRAASIPTSRLNTSTTSHPSVLGIAINTILERLSNTTCRNDTAFNAEELTYEKTYSSLELQYQPQSRLGYVILLVGAFWLHSTLFAFYLGAIAWSIWTSSIRWPWAPVLYSKLIVCNAVLMVLSCLHFGSHGGAIPLRSLQEYVDEWPSGSWLVRGVEFTAMYLMAKCKS